MTVEMTAQATAQEVDWEAILAVSTVVLAVATLVLAVAAVWAAVVALSGLSESRKTAQFTKDLAEADTRRRRAEVSHEALRRYMEVQATNRPIMLSAARAVTAERQAAAGVGKSIDRCSIEELLAGRRPPEDAIDALQKCLDALEEIAVGCRLGIYDPYVIYHGAATMIRQNYDFGRAHIKRVRQGQVEHREGQETAYTHIEWLVDIRFASMQGEPPKLAGALEGA